MKNSNVIRVDRENDLENSMIPDKLIYINVKIEECSWSSMLTRELYFNFISCSG